jgi:FkbM family methyltransferase
MLKKLIPKKYTFALTHIKKSLGLSSFSKQTFSAAGEDIILNELLFGNLSNGFFVDIGCYHPKLYSNTYQLYRRGWNGINVDPNRESIRLFNLYRKRDTNLQSGISLEAKQSDYYNFSHSGINTFSANVAEKSTNKKWNTLLKVEKINCMPLSQLLDKYLPVNKTIDLLDIDVEGLDMDVLKSNNWEKYRPRVILVEDLDFRNSLSESEIYLFLKDQRYKFYGYLDITLIMVEENFSMS